MSLSVVLWESRGPFSSRVSGSKSKKRQSCLLGSRQEATQTVSVQIGFVHSRVIRLGHVGQGFTFEKPHNSANWSDSEFYDRLCAGDCNDTMGPLKVSWLAAFHFKYVTDLQIALSFNTIWIVAHQLLLHMDYFKMHQGKVYVISFPPF